MDENEINKLNIKSIKTELIPTSSLNTKHYKSYQNTSSILDKLKIKGSFDTLNE